MVLGLDIGGANLKAADGRGFATVRPFALWREPTRLADELRALVDACPQSDQLAVTMTGELCDCFATKSEGVRAILDAVSVAAGDRRVAVYLTDGRFVSAHDACESPLLAAASNWHALAAFAAAFAAGEPALLVDVGSTTSDLIPIDAAGPAALGRTDPERLATGELVYTGVERTPIAAVVGRLPWRGGECPVASELFATTADAYLLLGELPEEPENRDTADGRGRTRAAAHARLARMICADSTMFSVDEALAAANAVCESQLARLGEALHQVVDAMPALPRRIILSGHGEFLARRLVERVAADWPPVELVSLSKALGSTVSRSATAHAVAILAGKKFAHA